MVQVEITLACIVIEPSTVEEVVACTTLAVEEAVGELLTLITYVYVLIDLLVYP